MAFDNVRLCVYRLLLVGILAGGVGLAQNCVVNATTNSVHAEGLAEKLGDISVSCTGGTTGATASLSLFISLNTAITNKVDVNGDPIGITAVTAPGSAAAFSVGGFRLSSPSSIAFNAVNYVVPAAGVSKLIVSGIRGAVSTIGGNLPVQASVLGIGATFNSGALLPLSTSITSLLSSGVSNGVPCTGSPLPATLDLSGFLSSATASTVRVTEAYATAFLPQQPGDDSGTRILVKMTGYGPGARIFVPDGIVGNSGTAPTSAGAFSSSAGPGTYTPGANQLLLARVAGADANGAGGNPSFGLPAAVTTFSTMTELTVTNGSAQAVFEVLDGNAGVQESAHIPVFVVVPVTSCPSTLTPAVNATLAPVSTVATASGTAPVPRFVAATPGSDCSVLSDCNAPYYPKLSVDQTPVNLTGSSLGDPQSAFVRVGNSGAGQLAFTTSVAYGSGANWLTVSPPSGFNSVTLQVIADSSKLAPGTYTATVTVSAGQYGSGTIPVTFTVGPVGVVVQNVGNAASFTYGTVAPGSYAVVYGLNMAGKSVSVTFNGLPASLVYTSATQINLIVPTALAAQQGASVIVTVDGLASNAFKVALVQNAPGVFNPGIVNFVGGQVNTVTTPANRGDIVLVFLTGLATPVTGQVTLNIGGLTNVIPLYAGAQGTLPALNQVNVVVPSSLPASPSAVPLQVCIPGTVGQQICSNSVNLYIK